MRRNIAQKSPRPTLPRKLASRPKTLISAVNGRTIDTPFVGFRIRRVFTGAIPLHSTERQAVTYGTGQYVLVVLAEENDGAGRLRLAAAASDFHLMFDIDRFETVTDTFDHPLGDTSPGALQTPIRRTLAPEPSWIGGPRGGKAARV